MAGIQSSLLGCTAAALILSFAFAAHAQADAGTAAKAAGKPAATAAKPAAAKPADAKTAATVSDKDAAVPTHQKHPLDTDMPTPKGKKMELKVGDQTAIAYVARPAGEPKGSVLVLHEYWGLNDWIKHEADELAASGYLALAVDLYKGQVATDPDTAGKLMAALDKEWASKVERAGIQWLKAQAPAHNLATIGWCMGGGQSLQASLANASDVAATVIYYGPLVSNADVLARLKGGAVLGFFGKKDGWITPDKVADFDAALTQAGVEHQLHSYDAEHAFANPSGGKHNPEAARESWKLTKAFLASHLN